MARENKAKYAILGMLSGDQASGYDIKKKMAETTNHFWYEGDSSIYPALKQLLKNEYVSFWLENETSDKPKKVYAITDSGKALLKSWLEKPPEPTKDRDELLLKLFFGWNVSKDISIYHIKNYKQKYEKGLLQYKKYYEHVLQNQQTKKTKYYLLTIKAGIISSEAAIKWCDEAINLLSATD